jgi:GNAT superfamily N-acetyltransferase
MNLRQLTGDEITVELCQAYLNMMDDSFFNPTLTVRKTDPEYMSNYWRLLVQRGVGMMVVLETPENKVVGMIAGMVGQDTLSPARIAVEALWRVAPEARGQGHKLLEYFESWAFQQGCELIFSTCMNNTEQGKLTKKYWTRGYFCYGYQFVKIVPQEKETW